MNGSESRRFSPTRRTARFDARAVVGKWNIPITVTEISYKGMRIELPYPIEPGAGITIEIMDDKIPAIVHWCNSNVAGVRLLENPQGATLRMLEASEDELSEFR